MFRIIRKIAAATTICVTLAVALPAAHAMDVYLFRGLAGVPFSVGLDDLESQTQGFGHSS